MTELLREKLDKLGIEHLDSDLPNNKQTRWNKGAGGWGACYVEITHGSILPADSIIDCRTLRIYNCTPEQAIAATLGSEISGETCEWHEDEERRSSDERASYCHEAAALLEEFLCGYQSILLTRGINTSEAVRKQNELIDEYAERIVQVILADSGLIADVLAPVCVDETDIVDGIYRRFYPREKYCLPIDPTDMINEAIDAIERERDEWKAKAIVATLGDERGNDVTAFERK